ncbi:ulk kinase [Cystoisospora suis]|uniref:non-specific serine/threonine protein kinase n=1 Tax=Cystoisospora suis TaxID=483139 RepID=A0A2C6LF81_9APIC|nr:ulk kinase [Cystoisospora suis]
MSKKKVGVYILDERIGRGSFAAVWKGHREQTNEIVAIKVISRQTVHEATQLNQEVAVLKQLQHPNIVRFIDLKKSQQRYYLVLEFCSGGDVSSVLRKNGGRIEESFARHLLQQIASGLFEIHRRNYIHRDLKPQNLLLSSFSSTGCQSIEGTLKIADFGFARSLKPWDLAATICGSPLYMAPEILRHECYDAKSDLWSVGTILFEMLHGSPPFSGQNPLQLLKNIEEANRSGFPSLRSSAVNQVSLSGVCRDLLVRLLKFDPEERLSPSEFFSHPFVLGCESIPLELVCRGVTESLASGSSCSPVSQNVGLDTKKKRREKKHQQQHHAQLANEDIRRGRRTDSSSRPALDGGDKQSGDAKADVHTTVSVMKEGDEHSEQKDFWGQGQDTAHGQCVPVLKDNKTQKEEHEASEGQQIRKLDRRECGNLDDSRDRVFPLSRLEKGLQTALAEGKDLRVVKETISESGFVLKEAEERNDDPAVHSKDRGGRTFSSAVERRGVMGDRNQPGSPSSVRGSEVSQPVSLQEAKCLTVTEHRQPRFSSKTKAEGGRERRSTQQFSPVQRDWDEAEGHHDRNRWRLHPLPTEKGEEAALPDHSGGAAYSPEDRSGVFTTGDKRSASTRRLHRVSTEVVSGVSDGSGTSSRVTSYVQEEGQGNGGRGEGEIQDQRGGDSQPAKRVILTGEYSNSFNVGASQSGFKRAGGGRHPLEDTTVPEEGGQEKQKSVSQEVRNRQGQRGGEREAVEESVNGVGRGVCVGKSGSQTDEGYRETLHQGYADHHRESIKNDSGLAKCSASCVSSTQALSSCFPAAARLSVPPVRPGSMRLPAHDVSSSWGEEAQLNKSLRAFSWFSRSSRGEGSDAARHTSPGQMFTSTSNPPISLLPTPKEPHDRHSSGQTGRRLNSSPSLSLHSSASFSTQEAEERDYVLVASEDVPPQVSRRSLGSVGPPPRYRPAVAAPFKGAGASLLLPCMHSFPQSGQRSVLWAHSRNSLFSSVAAADFKTHYNTRDRENSCQVQQRHRASGDAGDAIADESVESRKREPALSDKDVCERALQCLAHARHGEGKGGEWAGERDASCASGFLSNVGQSRRGKKDGRNNDRGNPYSGSEDREGNGQGVIHSCRTREKSLEGHRPDDRSGKEREEDRPTGRRETDDEGVDRNCGCVVPLETAVGKSGSEVEGREKQELFEGKHNERTRAYSGMCTGDRTRREQEEPGREEKEKCIAADEYSEKGEEKREKRKRSFRERHEGKEVGCSEEETQRGGCDSRGTESRHRTAETLSSFTGLKQNGLRTPSHCTEHTDSPGDREIAERSKESGESAEKEFEVSRQQSLSSRTLRSNRSGEQEDVTTPRRLAGFESISETGEKGRRKDLSRESSEQTHPRRVSFASPPSSAVASPHVTAQKTGGDSFRQKSPSSSFLSNPSSLSSFLSSRTRTTSGDVLLTSSSVEGEAPVSTERCRISPSQASLPSRRTTGSVSRHVSNLTTVAVEFLALAQQLGMHAAARRCHEERCKRSGILQLMKSTTCSGDQGLIGALTKRGERRKGGEAAEEKETTGKTDACRKEGDLDVSVKLAEGSSGVECKSTEKANKHESRNECEEMRHANEVIEEGEEDFVEEETSSRIATSALSVLMPALRLLERALSVATDESTEAAVKGTFREAVLLGKWCALVARGFTPRSTEQEDQAASFSLGQKGGKECDLKLKKEGHSPQMISSRHSLPFLAFPPSFFFLSHGTPTLGSSGSLICDFSSSSLCFHHLHCQDGAGPFPSSSPSYLSPHSPGMTPLLPFRSSVSPSFHSSSHRHILLSSSRASPSLLPSSLAGTPPSLRRVSTSSVFLGSRSPHLEPVPEASSSFSSSCDSSLACPSSGSSSASLSCSRRFNRAAENNAMPISRACASSRAMLCPPSPLLLPSSVLSSSPRLFPPASSIWFPGSSSAASVASGSVPASPFAHQSASSPLLPPLSSSSSSLSPLSPSLSCVLPATAYPPSPSGCSPGLQSGNISTSVELDGQTPERGKQHCKDSSLPDTFVFPWGEGKNAETGRLLERERKSAASSVIATSAHPPRTPIEAASDFTRNTLSEKTLCGEERQEREDRRRGSFSESMRRATTSEEEKPRVCLSEQRGSEDKITLSGSRCDGCVDKRGRARSSAIFIFGSSTREDVTGGPEQLTRAKKEERGSDKPKTFRWRSSACSAKGSPYIVPGNGWTSSRSSVGSQTSTTGTREREAEETRARQIKERRRCPLCCPCYYCKEAEEDVFSCGSMFCLGDSLMPPLSYFVRFVSKDCLVKRSGSSSCASSSSSSTCATVASSACDLSFCPSSLAEKDVGGDGVRSSSSSGSPLRFPSSASCLSVQSSIFSSSSPVKPLSPSLPRLHVLSLAVGRLRHLLEVNAKQLGSQILVFHHQDKVQAGSACVRSVSGVLKQSHPAHSCPGASYFDSGKAFTSLFTRPTSSEPSVECILCPGLLSRERVATLLLDFLLLLAEEQAQPENAAAVRRALRPLAHALQLMKRLHGALAARLTELGQCSPE